MNIMIFVYYVCEKRRTVCLKFLEKCKPWKFLRKMYKMNQLRVYTRNNVFIPEYLVGFKTCKNGK